MSKQQLWDSKLEKYFLWYIKELYDAGYIEAMYWHKKSFLLSPKVEKEVKQHGKIRKKERGIIDLSGGKFHQESKKITIIPEHIFTPEAIIVWKGESAKGLFYWDIDDKDMVYKKDIPFIAQRATIPDLDGVDQKIVSIVEVKPDYDFKNMTRLVKVNKQFLYSVTGLVLSLCLMPSLFKKTFTPNRYLLTDVQKTPRKINFNTITLQEYVQKSQSSKSI